MAATVLRLLFIGDVIGSPGMAVFQRWLPKIVQQHSIDSVIVNGENAAKNGKGISPANADFFKHNGVAVITTGNHAFEQKTMLAAFDERNDVIRPANYPPGCPGKGYTFTQINGHSVAIINLMGRGLMRDPLDCPFRTIESLLIYIQTRTNLIFVDFHAEATAEKQAMGIFLDGKVSAVLGTHTHVQTADERILPQGTGYLTDLGSCGAEYSVIGFQADLAMQRLICNPFLGKHVVETRGPLMFNGAWLDVDIDTGKAVKIERVYITDHDINTFNNENSG